MVWEGQYWPFGDIYVQDTDPDLDGKNVYQPFRFPGQYEDAETGLYYNYFRDYDPTIGRYIEFVGKPSENEPNIYVYANANPVKLIDPLGLEPITKNKKKDCFNADPLKSDSPECDKYGDRRYKAASLKCFCKCAGDSDWSMDVRGCLSCMDDKGIPTSLAHSLCYDSATAEGYDMPILTLGSCWFECLAIW